MGRKKAGMCRCGHELRIHDDEGHCHYADGTFFAGACTRDHGGPCARPRKKRKRSGPVTSTTRTITVDGGKVIEGFDLIIRGLNILRAEVTRGKTEGAKSITRLLDEVPAPSRRAEVPKSAAPQGHTTPLPTSSDEELSTGARVVLAAIAADFSTNAEIVVATGYAERTIQNLLTELAAHGLITRDRGASAITEAGRGEFPGGLPQAPTAKKLIAEWSERLGEGERKCFAHIVEHRGCSVADLADHVNLAERTVQNILTELARWRLVRRSRGRATLVSILGGPSSS